MIALQSLDQEIAVPELRIRGARSDESGNVWRPRERNGIHAEIRTALSIDASRASAEPVKIDVADDSVLVVHLEGGFDLVTRFDQFRQDYPQAAGRGASPDSYEIPVEFAQPEVSRGIGNVLLKGLEIFGVDLAGATAAQIAGRVEAGLDRSPGLYAWLNGAGLELSDAPARPKAGDALVFIHGTASSTRGSFADISLKAEREPETLGTRLANWFRDNIFAFEHRTLTHSPLDNAVELAGLLEEDTRLHLVTHSRGGLVGDLLCLGSLDTAVPNGVLSRLFQEPERDKFEKLYKTLSDRKIKVERFVRVASPSRGTTLMSRRADRWLSILLSLFGRLPVIQTVRPLYEALQDFLLAVARERMDPSQLPGLAAMMPDSPLVRVLNYPAIKSSADLSVIAGVAEGSGWLGALAMAAPTFFYGGANDLVVNTASMDGGLPCAGAWICRDDGPEVSHFNYFHNASTREAVYSGLTSKSDPRSGFERLERKEVTIPDRCLRGPSGPRPALFLLPGIMGSHLAVAGDRIWLDYTDIALGRLTGLRIEAAGVRPESIMADFYGRLVGYLSESHEVIVFAFDWRKSLRDEARRLAPLFKEKLDSGERDKQPVRILAHSMGGLLARVMIAQDRALWDRMCQHPGGRLIMLGTPNGGSHEILRVLSKQAATFRKLALLDLFHDGTELLDIIGRYPGLLEMLPRQPGRDFFQDETWNSLRSVEEFRTYPLAQDIRNAAVTRGLLDQNFFDPGHMVYVAGCGRLTPSVMTVNGGVKFGASAYGDSKVLWASGIPTPRIPTYYMDAEHGDMANVPGYFPAIRDLLETGTTSRLDVNPPVSRGAAEDQPLPPDPVEVLPGATDLAASAMGGSPGGPKMPGGPRLKVTITHGNVRFARHTVVVGHYISDSIVGPEAVLDGQLEQRLSVRHQLGVYPGALGTAEVFLNPDRFHKPGGALVVGLGTVGSLTSGKLEQTVYSGVLRYLLSARECRDDRFQQCGPSLTALLIGTLAGGVTIKESMSAILRAVTTANRTSAATGSGIRIREVEFLDLWEDRAIQAANALDRISKDGDLRGQIDVNLQVQPRTGGRRRIDPGEDPEWWSRLRIEQQNAGLKFSVISNRARIEVDLVAEERQLADQFISAAISTTSTDSELSGALFEMLVPNRLKELTQSLTDTVLILDKDSARYPWELMEDRLGHRQKPLSIECSFIRQLETEDFREVVTEVHEPAALVVGSPIAPKYQRLDGATAEAVAVCDVLKRKGVAVSEQIETEAADIVRQLFARPYRMLHFAAHGVHEHRFKNPDGTLTKPTSGMVIGDHLVLTPALIKQMRRVPEFVFINCCHLGRTDRPDQIELPRNDRHRLAANLAVEFIRMGVRAVIAAGWAVNDRAAAVFAQKFYQSWLFGDTFGVAVHEARLETWQQYRSANTWGAYQCYGDTDFSFEGKRSDRRRVCESGFRTESQFVTALENLTEKANLIPASESAGVKAEFDQTVSRVPDKWAKGARACYEKGMFLGAIGDYHAAADAFDESSKQDKALAAVKAIEQSVNMRVRGTAQDCLTGKLSREEASKCIEDAIERLAKLRKLAGETAERWGLMGSCYKRLASIADAEPSGLIRRMRNAYRSMHKLAGSATVSYTGPITNWLTAEAILRWRNPAAKDWVQDTAAELDDLIVKGEKLAEEDPSFWNAVVVPDCLLVRYLAEPTEELLKQTAEGYRRARDQGGSEREVRSVTENLEFIAAMARLFGKPDLAGRLDEVVRFITASEKAQWIVVA